MSAKNNWYQWKKKGAELLAEIQTGKEAEHQIVFWFLGQEGCAFKYQDQIILIDPVLNDIYREDGSSAKMYEVPFLPEELSADFVLCTHGHIDHMAEETLLGLIKGNPKIKIVIPAGCRELAGQYGIGEENLLYLTPGETCTLSEKIKVHAMSASHPSHVYDADDESMAFSYELTFGEKRVVHLGDTYLTDALYGDLSDIRNMDVLMMPINGDDYFRKKNNIIGNIEAEEAAKLACDLEAKLSIPLHFDMMKGNLANPLRFAEKIEELDAKRAYRIPLLGDKILL